MNSRRMIMLFACIGALVLGAILMQRLISPEEKGLRLLTSGFDALPGWRSGDPRPALAALKHSCQRILNQPKQRSQGNQWIALTGYDWQPACRALVTLNSDDSEAVWHYFEQFYVPYTFHQTNQSQGLFTGYYLPSLRGSSVPSQQFRFPVYGVPDDLVTFNPAEFEPQHPSQRWVGRLSRGAIKPYLSRAEIGKGALRSHAAPLLWVDDLVDLFFMQIQGSGKVKMPDGQSMLLGYAAQNGRPYTALGRALIKAGQLKSEQVSMPAIRRFLRKHQEQQDYWLNKNASYVFFRRLSNTQPLGAQGVPLTPAASMAVDRRYVPLGLPIWLSTIDRDTPWESQRRLAASAIVDALVGQLPQLYKQPQLQQLLVAQDTGGAIRGPVRGDVYWGEGHQAATLAGYMQATGTYWLLIPKG